MGEAGEFFDSFAHTFDTFYDGKRSWWMRWLDFRFRRGVYVRYQRTFDILQPIAGKTILDIGCGSGPYLVEALKRGASHVTGIDPAPEMLAIARQRADGAGFGDKVSLLHEYFPSSQLPQKHDYGIVMGVMDYVSDAPAFLGALRSVIRDVAVLSFPSKHWYRSPIREARYRLRRCPVYFYGRSDIADLMARADIRDFAIEKVEGAGQDFVVTVRNAGPVEA